MSDTQLLTIPLAAVPTMLTVLVRILDQQRKLNDLNNRIADLRIDMDSRFGHVNHRFDEVRDLWHAEL